MLHSALWELRNRLHDRRLTAGLGSDGAGRNATLLAVSRWLAELLRRTRPPEAQIQARLAATRQAKLYGHVPRRLQAAPSEIPVVAASLYDPAAECEIR